MLFVTLLVVVGFQFVTVCLVYRSLSTSFGSRRRRHRRLSWFGFAAAAAAAVVIIAGGS